MFVGVFLFWGSDFGRVARCLKKKSFSTRKPTEKGAFLHTLLCNTPLPAPLYCLQYCAIYFPHDPLYCNKILTISCKGQPPAVVLLSHDETASSQRSIHTVRTPVKHARATPTHHPTTLPKLPASRRALPPLASGLCGTVLF